MREWRDFVEEGAVPKELTEEHPIIAIYGGYQVGKSTLLNCLLGQYVALVGKGIATTALVSRYRYGRCSILRYRTRPASFHTPGHIPDSHRYLVSSVHSAFQYCSS